MKVGTGSAPAGALGGSKGDGPAGATAAFTPAGAVGALDTPTGGTGPSGNPRRRKKICDVVSPPAWTLGGTGEGRGRPFGRAVDSDPAGPARTSRNLSRDSSYPLGRKAERYLRGIHERLR